jgi:formate hydrogenlyase subunit 3/multisubunit Na+/H+ antiporter MnhD subunit
MNFFILMMLTLVLADNYLLLYVGWEGVGLASYLLIGFWFETPSAADAGKKAFLVNRVGDVGFILAMLAIWTLLGTLNFMEVTEAAEHGAFTLAAAKGVNVTAGKVLAFAIGAAIAGAGGALKASFLRVAAPASFEYLEGINLVLIVIIGGAGTLRMAWIGSGRVFSSTTVSVWLPSWR